VFKKRVVELTEKYKKDTFVNPTEVRTTVEKYVYGGMAGCVLGRVARGYGYEYDYDL